MKDQGSGGSGVEGVGEGKGGLCHSFFITVHVNLLPRFWPCAPLFKILNPSLTSRGQYDTCGLKNSFTASKVQSFECLRISNIRSKSKSEYPVTKLFKNAQPYLQKKIQLFLHCVKCINSWVNNLHLGKYSCFVIQNILHAFMSCGWRLILRWIPFFPASHSWQVKAASHFTRVSGNISSWKYSFWKN